MAQTVQRKPNALRRVLFLCSENYHESRFCEELFNSHSRGEGINWLGLSRAVTAVPALRNEGPMSVTAINYLRVIGAAPVNYLRLPLQVTDFDFQMSYIVIVLGTDAAQAVRWAWPHYASQIERWSVPETRERHSRTTLAALRREVGALVEILQGRAPTVGRPAPQGLGRYAAT